MRIYVERKGIMPWSYDSVVVPNKGDSILRGGIEYRVRRVTHFLRDSQQHCVFVSVSGGRRGLLAMLRDRFMETTEIHLDLTEKAIA